MDDKNIMAKVDTEPQNGKFELEISEKDQDLLKEIENKSIQSSTL